MHLDPSKLDELAELADGDLEFVADLLETYLDDALPRTQSLREAISTGDVDSAAALAHALKSGSANVGATTIAGHFAQIEEAGSTWLDGHNPKHPRPLAQRFESTVADQSLACGTPNRLILSARTEQ